MAAYLKDSSYGKTLVRLLKKEVDAKTGVHTVHELTVEVLLKGEFETAYTKGDNGPVVPTDTMKNTVFILAKSNPVAPIETFGAVLAQYLVEKYAWVASAHVHIIQQRWSRIELASGPHPYSFLRDGEDVKTSRVSLYRAGPSKGIHVTSGMEKLLILKSTGSAFYGFNKCDYTTLKETWDRIFSTEVTASWTWPVLPTLDAVKANAAVFDAAAAGARAIILDTFATDDSASVQATMYKAGEATLAAHKGIVDISYSLPNKHYFDWDGSPFGIDNTGKNTTVYVPQANPSGLIKATIARRATAKL